MVHSYNSISTYPEQPKPGCLLLEGIYIMLDTTTQQEPKLIRFIDINYNNLFFLPDGESIRLTYPDGDERIRPCKYMGEYHMKVGHEVFHICQFAEFMERNGTRYAPENPLPLPDRCHAVHPGTEELIVLRRGERGYTVSPFSQGSKESNQRLADQENGACHIGRQQVFQMLAEVFTGNEQKLVKKHRVPER